MGEDDTQYGILDKAFYLNAEDGIWVRPGLTIEILDIAIGGDRKPAVTFKLTDNKGQALDRGGILTPGAVSTSFCFAYIPSGANQYVNYFTRTVTSPITNATAKQATTDSGGQYDSLGDGVYRYTFGNALPEGYDQSLTHTIAVYGTRDLAEFGLSRYVANTLKNFVPNGSQVTKVREVVATVSCNQCHNPLALHGGSRRETGLCIMCHTPQTSDPDTGNTVDFKVMVHKIHRGHDLPSVQAGKPYQIIGNRQSVHDFSTVAFPRDVRNCAACHQNTSQTNNYLLNPSRETCGSCHDDVNFASGVNHPGGAQPNDDRCGSCHWPQGDLEYDSSIAGAHTVPDKSTQLRKPKMEIVDVTNTGAGQNPTVRFRITDRNGNAIAPTAMSRISLRLGGPTTDYKWYQSENVDNSKLTFTDGIPTYTLAAALPADAQGTYTVGMEGRLTTTLNAGTTKAFTYNDGAPNVIKDFAVTGASAPRRVVVDVGKCNKCHDRLQFHGNSRNDPQYCVGCHNPTKTGRGEAIHFKVMIHKIHTGEELNSSYVIGSHNFNEVRFPGDRRDCTTCHVGVSYTLPLPQGVMASTTPNGYWTPTSPVAASCLSCHDSLEAAAHAFLNTASFGESCVVCHKEGAEFAVSKVHAR
jgi:OmcA/MtrC family decaheme c-type cytochrome